MKREVLVLREAEIRELLEPAACIDAVEKAFSAYAQGQAELPAVINLEIPERAGEVHVKAGHLRGGSDFAVKIASGFPGNAELGLPTGNGLVLAFDAATGVPSALLLDNGYITDLRTAAAGAVAARHLARAQAKTVAVLGTGVQARFQPRMLALVRRFKELRIWGRNRQRARECADELGRSGSLPAECRVGVAESVAEAVAGAEIVVTVTASREPIVKAEWIGAGTLIIAAGSDGPDKQELEAGVLARADRIVADSLPQCLRLGEIHHAVEQGAIAKEKVAAELGEITSGKKPGRQSEDEIIVCDLTGVGVQDVAAAALVLERARADGRGERLGI
jgi:ectoine utilization protein EutC